MNRTAVKNLNPKPGAVAASLLLLLLLAATTSAQTHTVLVWSDEFNGPAGSAVDSTKWVAEVGNGSNGWGNHQREYNTNSTKNAATDGAGNLVITAIKESLGNRYRCWYGECQ